MPPLMRIMDLVSLVTCKPWRCNRPNGEMIVCDTCLVCYYFYTVLMETPSNANNASNAAPFSPTRAYIIQNKNFTLKDHKQGMERSGRETLDSRMKV